MNVYLGKKNIIVPDVQVGTLFLVFPVFCVSND